MPRTAQQVNGHLRPDVTPELMGSKEIVALSGRSAPSALYHYADTYSDWPQPVAILAQGPVYVADEMRAFFKKYPPQTRLTEAQIQEIRELTAGVKGPRRDKELAERFNVGTNVILGIRLGSRGRASRAKPKD